MTGGSPLPGRLSARQFVGWALAFLVIIVLIVLFFIYGRQVRPVLGALPLEAWPKNLS
ncbi:MAG TPA: hypothetical protein VGI92_03560 [Gemmatimonadales bacterium]|jgi:hypothetical protein